MPFQLNFDQGVGPEDDQRFVMTFQAKPQASPGDQLAPPGGVPTAPGTMGPPAGGENPPP